MVSLLMMAVVRFSFSAFNFLQLKVCFLSFCAIVTFLGIYYLFDLVEAAVTEELATVSLKDRVDRQIMRELLQRVENRISANFPENMVEMVAPITTENVSFHF